MTWDVMCAGNGSFSCEDCIPDNVNHAKDIRELYEKVNDTGGRPASLQPRQACPVKAQQQISLIDSSSDKRWPGSGKQR